MGERRRRGDVWSDGICIPKKSSCVLSPAPLEVAEHLPANMKQQMDSLFCFAGAVALALPGSCLSLNRYTLILLPFWFSPCPTWRERVAAWGWAAWRSYTTARPFSCYDGSRRRIPHRQLPKNKLAPAFTFWLPLLEIRQAAPLAVTSPFVNCWMQRAVLSVVQVFPTSPDTWT